ncbi:ENPP4-like protein [Mya arenaria]|uniref:ENPP4-like protein n=1 Tax=Mya arenaria TaxID=6604 RepID=A0ABY7DGS6_MYAAR|nr:bis(5'-adenosyl)-triphosphatase ENPP4-like [Mya arenaria]WAQ96882.1 ENPP4-like protein [Mya arenaria]
MSVHSMCLVFLNIFLCGFLHVESSNKVLVISMDGFRWDYIQKANTPNFDDFAAKGTRAKYINNTFITKTFPCHYSIATGLFEESHGIIANSMYDPVTQKHFTMSSKESFWWDGGEPLWATVQRSDLRSAVYYWPGSEAEIRGLRPNIYFPYNESVNFYSRVDTVVQWLANDSYNIDFAMLYFHEPDHTGHMYGPDSTEVLTKVEEMDAILGYIVESFTNASLWANVNVLVTSDHGMTEISHDKTIDLLAYVDNAAMEQVPSMGPVANIRVADGMLEEVIANLSSAPHLKVYRREEVPEFWYYKNNERILDIVAVADEHWSIIMNASAYTYNGKGGHGYDNRLMSMKPIFYARGPDIRSGYETRPFNSVDIYPTVCRLLGARPAPNNGTIEHTSDFVTLPVSQAASVRSQTVLSVSLIYVSMAIFCVQEVLRI